MTAATNSTRSSDAGTKACAANEQQHEIAFLSNKVDDKGNGKDCIGREPNEEAGFNLHLEGHTVMPILIQSLPMHHPVLSFCCAEMDPSNAFSKLLKLALGLHSRPNERSERRPLLLTTRTTSTASFSFCAFP